MPRQPDPDLEARILQAAHALWKRGGEKALTMRAVARAARTNTPAVYRRFRNRRDLVRGVIRQIAMQIRENFRKRNSIEEMAEAYIDNALELPNDYELFYTHSYSLSPPKGPGTPRPIRESRPNFALVEDLLAERLGGAPGDHTQLTLSIWATLHGTCMLLLSRTIPEGHEAELRRACRATIKALLDQAQRGKRK
ncbi:MAG TPA: TetR/AcrR family transcriptional regulator [Candidatus Solibacter sp.]|nr:TetR/AcrR family transcriptional regulator [Candidatus Solibacter sp.]